MKQCVFFIFFSVFLGELSAAETTSTTNSNVDLELILAVDCSYSVDQSEYALQMNGIAYALRSPEVKQAIQMGRYQRIAIALIQWSSTKNQSIAIPWTIISSSKSIDEVANAIERLPRAASPGSTSISAVIAKSLHLFSSSPLNTNRRVIDISGDGRNNDGVPPHFLRDVAVEKGITINGLAILNEIPSLHYYFRKQIAGGFGSFVIKANSYRDYKQAIHEKLIREIASLPVAQNTPEISPKY